MMMMMTVGGGEPIWTKGRDVGGDYSLGAPPGRHFGGRMREVQQGMCSIVPCWPP